MEEVFNSHTNRLIEKHGMEVITDFSAADPSDEKTIGEYRQQVKELGEKYELTHMQTLAILRDIRK